MHGDESRVDGVLCDPRSESACENYEEAPALTGRSGAGLEICSRSDHHYRDLRLQVKHHSFDFYADE